MKSRRCPAHRHCNHSQPISRRLFLEGSAALLGSAALAGPLFGDDAPKLEPIQLNGPASKLTPNVKVAFVRRKEEYGMWWPGQVYDGEAARKKYTHSIRKLAKQHGTKIDIREQPIFSLAEGQAWIDAAKKDKSDGLFLVLLDRQQHTWPTAAKAVESGLPTVVYSPIGSSFTTNTVRLADKPHSIIYATDDFTQPAYGLKMLHAGAKLKATRYMVLCGDQRKEQVMDGLGITLQYVPASDWIKLYNDQKVTAEVEAICDEYLRRARRTFGATREDVLNGARAYVTARALLHREQADGLTMDCLGAIGRKHPDCSLPCLAWSRMNDEAVPASCEADLGAVASQCLVQYLFDRPGFQQDPVPETARQAIIGAHCSCPTKLHGWDQPSEPFDIRHHHAERDATTKPYWKAGQAVTSLDVNPGKPPTLLIARGEVLENVGVPPAGGCVVSVMVKFENVTDPTAALKWPGFHQLFFYGDYKQQLADFAKLYNLKSEIV